MSIPKKIINYLDKNEFKYEIVEHKTTYTAWDVSQTKKINPREIVKTLVVKLGSREYALALITSDKNLDKKKLLKIVNASKKKSGEKCAKKVDFAKEAWMKKNIPGSLGAVPPFGGLLKMSIYVDNLVLKNKKLYLGSGDYESSLLMTVAQYIKHEDINKGSFNSAKKIKGQKLTPKKKRIGKNKKGGAKKDTRRN
jgi:prolyl-tRNA editing enzyme YbaK/EbsC (Cys-tRNA(Pro) deacylase)